MNDIHFRPTLLGLGLLVGACEATPSNDVSTPGTTGGPPMTSSSSGGSGSGSEESTFDGDPTADASSTETTDADGATTETNECELDRIELPGDSFYPEGVASYGDTLFVGSIATGEVVRASTCDGAVEPFVAAGVLPGAVGLRVDELRGLLWVCASDSTQQTFASLEAFDLETGASVASHGWESPGMCNDIALDAAGNVYATDSFGHRILRVAEADALGSGPAETWLAADEFVVAPDQFGVNGIAWDPAGVLRIGSYADGRLFEVPVRQDGTAGPLTVLGDVGTLSGPDGILVHDQGLLIVEGLSRRLSHVDLRDLSVTPVAADFDFPTTVAVVGASAWVAEGQFDHLYGLDPTPPELPFEVRRVALR